MKEILLCKYGEIVLKGANKRFFEDQLCRVRPKMMSRLWTACLTLL